MSTTTYTAPEGTTMTSATATIPAETDAVPARRGAAARVLRPSATRARRQRLSAQARTERKQRPWQHMDPQDV